MYAILLQFFETTTTKKIKRNKTPAKRTEVFPSNTGLGAESKKIFVSQ
jgi:hypothetical protein